MMGQYDYILNNKPEQGKNDYSTKIRAFVDDMVAALNAIHAAAVANGSITEDKLDIYNAPIPDGFLSFNGTKFEWIEKVSLSQIDITGSTGDKYVPHYDNGTLRWGNITTGQIADKAVTPDKFGTSNDPEVGVLQIPILQADGSLKWETYINKTLIPDNEIPYTKLKMIGTPLPGYFQKFDYDTSGQMSLIAAPSANTEDSGMVKATEGAEYQWASDFLRDVLPDEVPNYSNLNNIGKAQEGSGGAFMYPPEMSFAYKIHDVNGTPVEATSASFYCRTLPTPTSGVTAGKTFEEWQTSGDFSGQIRPTSGGNLKYPNQWLYEDFRSCIQVSIRGSDKQVLTGLQHNLPIPLDGLYAGMAVKKVMASIPGKKGITGSTTIQILVKRPSVMLGDSTTRFDITNPTGTTFRYTYDGTGTNPNIADSDVSLRVGDWQLINSANFNAANNGWFKLTAVATNYFEVTNASGVAESDKTLGSAGYMQPIKVLLSSPLSLGDVWYADTTSFIAARNTLANYDVLMIEVISVHTTAPYGLAVSIKTGGINIAD